MTMHEISKSIRCALWLALPLAACSGGNDGPSAPDGSFDYATTRDAALGIHVTVDGSPAGRCRVQVASVTPALPGREPVADGVSGALFFAGLTDENGWLDSELRLPSAVDEVAVVVHRAGTSGAYTDPSLRDGWGHFAPSARVHVPIGSLSGIEVALVRD
ncbi:MAG: hypothetical protein AAGG01_22140 [Planctomycetota bacterium]